MNARFIPSIQTLTSFAKIVHVKNKAHFSTPPREKDKILCAMETIAVGAIGNPISYQQYTEAYRLTQNGKVEEAFILAKKAQVNFGIEFKQRQVLDKNVERLINKLVTALENSQK